MRRSSFLYRGEVSCINKKYDELKATLSNDTVEKFKEILKEEISKINDKLEGKICQLYQDKSFLQEQIKN